MSPTFDQFSSDFHDHFTRDANACVALGVAKHLDELPDPSLDGMANDLARAHGLLQRIDGLRREGQPFDEALDLDLAQLELERQVEHLTCEIDGRRVVERAPRAGDDIGDGMSLLFISDPRPGPERLADLTGRIEAVPAYLEGLKARIQEPVARWVEMDLEKVAELPGFFATLRGWADELSWADSPRLARASEAAEAALATYAAHLAGLTTHDRVHIGPEGAARTLSTYAIDDSPEDLHEMARDYLASTADTIERLRRRLAAKHGQPPDIEAHALRDVLDKRFQVQVGNAGADGILQRYETEHERILAFIEERDLFEVFPEQQMRIVKTPEFLAPSIPAGAMVPPPAFREGVRTSIVYLTLPDDRLAEHTELSIPSMMIHEGIPGHHLQLATASRHPSVIRRHVNGPDLAEGWTTMLEDYMLDLGYMGDRTDEARFCGKLDISRIGARVVIDLFFMSGQREFLDVGVDCDLDNPDAFAAAGSLLQTVTGFSDARTKGELNWYSQERGYPLTYLVGNQAVWKLKRQVDAARQGADALATDRLFHHTYLQAGNMPVSQLQRVFAHAGLLGPTPASA